METVTRKARKAHICTLCFETIPKGESYEHAPVRPWDHDLNDGFSQFKAHEGCCNLWWEIGRRYDWEFPSDKDAWRQMTEGMNKGGRG